MNPYDFVRIEWDNPGTRHPAPDGTRFTGLSGRLTGTLTTLTPFFIPDKQTANPQRFLIDRQRRAVIPGSSLKGLFRSVVETVGNCAFWFWDARDLNTHNLPRDFQPPRSSNELDAACRLFGFLRGRDVLAGRVSFDDATCEEGRYREADAIYTCILSTPKPHHRAWYLDQQERVSGRKFYFHATTLQTEDGWKPREAAYDAKRRQNAFIKPLEAGCAFTFQMSFSGITEEDLNLLLYALVLEPTMRHKLGYAKPAGLGSVEVAVTELEFVDHLARYRANGGIKRYTGSDLTTLLSQRTANYIDNHDSITLNDLRRIWRWPPPDDVTYTYPTKTWFENNPHATLDQTANIMKGNQDG
jgi:CRISPR/Cas system CSM-associated protein Csm3 (group 7 of RAMP superfamily)